MADEITSKIDLLTTQLGSIRVKKNFNLKDETKNKLSVIASAFYIATTARELIVVVQLCKDLGIPFMILGSGSKIVFHDSKYLGLVIKNRSDGLKFFGIKGKVSREGLGIEEVMLEADSGVSLTRLADYAALQKLGGFSELKNYNGTIGGSILNNQIIRDKAYQVKVFSEYESFENKDIAEVSALDIIISMTFKLKTKL